MVPVFTNDESDMVGVIKCKHFVGLEPETKVSDMHERISQQAVIQSDMSVIEVMGAMVHSNVHMAAVQDRDEGFIGVLTMKSILERIVSTGPAGFDGDLTKLAHLVPHHRVIGGKQLTMLTPLEEGLLDD